MNEILQEEKNVDYLMESIESENEKAKSNSSLVQRDLIHLVPNLNDCNLMAIIITESDIEIKNLSEEKKENVKIMA